MAFRCVALMLFQSLGFLLTLSTRHMGALKVAVQSRKKHNEQRQPNRTFTFQISDFRGLISLEFQQFHLISLANFTFPQF